MFLAPKPAGGVNQFPDGHPVAVSTVTASRPARVQFPAVMAFVPEPVKRLHRLVAAQHRKIAKHGLSALTFSRGGFYRGAGRAPVGDNAFPRRGGGGTQVKVERVRKFIKFTAVRVEQCEVALTKPDDVFARRLLKGEFGDA